MSFWHSRRAFWGFAALLVLVFVLWRPGADRFRSRLEQSLSSSLGHKVEIGNVSLQILPRPGFNLSQFSVRDDPQFSFNFWEVVFDNDSIWSYFQGSPVGDNEFDGFCWILRWERGVGALQELPNAILQLLILALILF